MNILSFFTDGGIPAEELTPKIRIVEVATGTAVISWASMIEISDGWYKYDFLTYDYKKEYIVVCDGGSSLRDSERYNAAANDNSRLEISQIVWDAQQTDHIISGSFGELLQQTSDYLKRVLGLVHENIYIDNPNYDSDNNLVNARVRLYSVPGSIGTDNDVIGSYLISSEGAGPGKFTNWSQIKI
jgi:hypothetical protein